MTSRHPVLRSLTVAGSSPNRGGGYTSSGKGPRPMSDAPMPVERFAQTLSPRVLHCRELGHNWKPSTVRFDQERHGYERTLRCANCRTERRQTLDARGHVVSNRYVYPEGYLTAGRVESGNISRDVFRMESINRWLESHTSKAG